MMSPKHAPSAPAAPRAKARLRAATAVVAIALALGGCKSVGLSDITGSIGQPETKMPQTDAALRQYAEQWGKRFEANPADKNAAINYSRALRALTQYAQAVAVLRQTAIKMPNDLEILGNYGKALADAGRLAEAAEVLQRAHTEERPNWSILSAQGAVADQMGDHQAAQNYYMAALKIAPDDPAVLSNLGLSQALSKQLPLAEQTLRRAAENPAADGRVRQNLALVLALQGKFTEAEATASRDLTPAQAAQNIATIRRMIAQSNTWRELQAIDGGKPAPGKAGTTAAAAARPRGGGTN